MSHLSHNSGTAMLEAHVLDEIGDRDEDTNSKENVYIFVGFVSELLAGWWVYKECIGDSTTDKSQNWLGDSRDDCTDGTNEQEQPIKLFTISELQINNSLMFQF